jgi:hypothetical protein
MFGKVWTNEDYGMVGIPMTVIVAVVVVVVAAFQCAMGFRRGFIGHLFMRMGMAVFAMGMGVLIRRIDIGDFGRVMMKEIVVRGFCMIHCNMERHGEALHKNEYGDKYDMNALCHSE